MAGIVAWRLVAVHAGYGQIINVKVRVFTYWVIPIGIPNCLHSHPGTYLHFILHLAGNSTGVAASASFKINN
jgi:hypothetical protein